MDELINDFLQESGENLDRLDQDFVKLEKEAGNPDLLKSIFRTIHTIKGTCGFLGFTKLEAFDACGRKPAVAAARWRSDSRPGDYRRAP